MWTAEPNYSTYVPGPDELWAQVGTSNEYGAWIDPDLLLRDFERSNLNGANSAECQHPTRKFGRS